MIHDPQEFGRRLADAVGRHHPGWRFSCGDVEYFDPLQVSVHEVEPLTWKHFRYAYQREYRLAWVPSSPRHDLTALDISVGSLTDIAEIAQPIES